jgi:hypothetical protein
VTVEAGIRLWPGIRWLTNATYSRHPLGLPTFYLDARTSGNATVLNVVRLMIGGEVRTFSASNCRTRFTALVGLISMNADGYVATFPATSRHLSGTATIDGISSASSGFTLGAGLLLWRFSLDITWTSFRPEYTSRVNVLYYSGSTSEIVNSAEESGGFVSIVFGVSIL